MIFAIVLAASCAGLMGFAIQRGGTCLVAALDEIVTCRKASRLVALLEASALVAGGIIAAELLGALQMAPNAFAPTGWTIAGGMVMGLGAYVAGSCVFGAIARIGNGEPAFLLVPAGFYLGCIAALRLGTDRLPQPLPPHSPLLSNPLLFAGPLFLLAGWRLWHVLSAARRRELASYAWSPHVATGIIGVTFVILLLAAGPWNYTDYLAGAARRMAGNGAMRGLLLLALFIGALLGGWTAGRIRARRPTGGAILRCLGGGVLLGLGGSLVPGANDGLILLGLPLLYPHAIVAVASMLVAITAAILVEQHAAMARKARLA